MTSKRICSGLIGVVFVAGAVACENQHSGGATAAATAVTSTAPSPLPTSAASAPAAPSMVGTWASTESTSAGTGTPATVPEIHGCTNFQWTVASQSSSAISGQFSVDCLGSITLTGTATGLIDGTTVQVTVTGTASLPTVASCSFSLGGTGTLIDSNTLSVPYTGTTCLGPVSGTEVLRRNQPSAPPPPPPPPPQSPPSGSDAINMSQATILNSPTDLATWAVTTAITRLVITSGGIEVDFSKKDGAGRWPDVTPPGWSGPLEYTLGMCLNISSHWYCSAPIEYWNGLDASGGPPSQYAQNWFYDPGRWAPMTGHQPAVGETIGFFVCEGDCRNNTTGTSSPLRERSNVVLVPMPSDAGATYTF